MTKLRFSNHPRANARHQGPVGPAGAQLCHVSIVSGKKFINLGCISNLENFQEKPLGPGYPIMNFCPRGFSSKFSRKFSGTRIIISVW